MSHDPKATKALPAHVESSLDATPDHTTIPVIRTIAMPRDTNPAGDIFGGWLMSQMDLGASTIATRRARGRTVTAAVEGMSFLSPVQVGDEVTIYGRIVSTGRSSMRVFVEAWRRNRESDDITKVTHATFTFVAIDAARKPRPLPEPDGEVKDR
ncbi:(3S)-malyl-CoA thioesterase [Kaistia soli DSM 19436]|uniref:(3S)-malyl-CoA thioesterase n=2 Tax=Kaistia TaxID=166953 RepID=A0A1M4UPC4_9HYPH|nr:(3S)-malyl-CoA thioesterase [Kaistia soli DSM 19436]